MNQPLINQKERKTGMVIKVIKIIIIVIIKIVI